MISLQRVAAILETEPRRRRGTNLEHAASSHGRSHFNPDYRLLPLAPVLILYLLMLFSLDLTGISSSSSSPSWKPKCFTLWHVGRQDLLTLSSIMDGDVDDDFMGIR